ncbi:MAG: FAD:protein transferase, partial [Frondihabitans sp.]|nr:FAD:protein transferase [Frondihabitans sp.]
MNTMKATQARTLGASTDWTIWSTSARIVVTDATALTRARQIADRILSDVEMACSRFRDDSELRRIG